MVYREIVRTCSHSKVAAAAVDSIGGEFARAFAAEAKRRNLARGALAAQMVNEFAAHADEVALQKLTIATHRSDVPLLSGLRYILENSQETPPAWMIAARRCDAAHHVDERLGAEGSTRRRRLQ